MTVSFSKQLIRTAKKLPLSVREQVKNRIEHFSVNPLDPILRNHKLKGPYREYGSININGDYRALYLMRGDEVIFDLVGTHAQLL